MTEFFSKFVSAMRVIRASGTKPITQATRYRSDYTVPIEASYIFVVGIDDELSVRTEMLDAHGNNAFRPVEEYPRPNFHRCVENEIGYVWGARILLDPKWCGPPGMYGAGQIEVRVP